MLLLLTLSLGTLQSPVGQYRAQLLKNVTEIKAPDAIPGPLTVDGNAFVFMTGRSGSQPAPLFAGEIVGNGRVIAGGHEAFFSEGPLKLADNRALLENCLTWLARKSLSQMRVACDDMPAVASFVSAAGGTAVNTNQIPNLTGIDVVCATQTGIPDRLAKGFDDYIRRGGSLLIVGPGWGWISTYPKKSLAEDHGGNRLLRPYGIRFVGGFLDGPFSGKDVDRPELTTTIAMDSLRMKQSDNRALAAVTAERALTYDLDGRWNRQLDEWMSGPVRIPTREHPITRAEPLDRLRLIAAAKRDQKQTVAAPSASDFPGPVNPSAPKIRRTIRLPRGVHGWISTGLYAAPGSPIAIAAGFKGTIRIGAHTDELWHLDSWERAPEVSASYEVVGPATIASRFGGLLYVDQTDTRQPTSDLITISGAVESPLYLEGQTTIAQWNAMRAAPAAPWSEIAARRVVLTVPSSVLGIVDDPAALTKYWDEVMELAFQLYSAPPRDRPERYTVDRQISAGYMHSGYPIMTGDDVAKDFVDVRKLRSQGSPVATWGFYHEMGHNFQEGEWTFDGTGEVTNNLLALYASEKLNGVTPATYGLAHKAMDPKAQRARLENYIADGARFEAWKSDPFLALTMYAELREAFGWSPFMQVFAEYRTLSKDEVPTSEREKHDQWMVRFSRQIGRNLGPFFQAWGVPTSEAARASISSLPTWMPNNFPGASR
jgi:hypothetical protein